MKQKTKIYHQNLNLSLYLEKINIIDIPPSTLKKKEKESVKKRERTHIINTRNENWNFDSSLTNIKRVLKQYYQ